MLNDIKIGFHYQRESSVYFIDLEWRLIAITNLTYYKHYGLIYIFLSIDILL